jgi:RNA polymerase sigma-70 factor (ECF subfamily)
VNNSAFSFYRIAGNNSRLYWRKHTCKETVSIESIDTADRSSDDSDRIVHNEQLKRLKAGVTRLPMKFRQVVVLHYMQHLTTAEAAEAAGIREGTFKSRHIVF